VAVGLNDDILVGVGSSIQLYDNCGKFVRAIQVVDDAGSCSAPAALPLKSPLTPQAHKALVGGIVVDATGAMILSTVTEKQRTYVSVSSYKGELKYTLDSYGARLRRPSGICITGDGEHCLVADLGNHCIKKFRFK
jgi:hypothetical protein